MFFMAVSCIFIIFAPYFEDIRTIFRHNNKLTKT